MRSSPVQRWVSDWIRQMSGPPAFQIWGRAGDREPWRIIDVYTTHRRNADSRWPLWRNHCITWTAHTIAVGIDFAKRLQLELNESPATRDKPVRVAGGRLCDVHRRQAAGKSSFFTCCELMAHECGHTGQALRAGALYWHLVGPLTLFREGNGWWHYFENQASETGQFGGVVERCLSDLLAVEVL